MKTMSFTTKKIAALAIAAAAAVSAQDLTATVPIGFTASGVKLAPGSYRVGTIAMPGVVLVRNGGGKPVAAVNMPMQTKIGERTSSSSLRFDLANDGYRLAEYCVAGRGCWASTGGAKKAAKSIEVALSR